jgi:hypothetical protein
VFNSSVCLPNDNLHQKCWLDCEYLARVARLIDLQGFLRMTRLHLMLLSSQFKPPARAAACICSSKVFTASILSLSIWMVYLVLWLMVFSFDVSKAGLDSRDYGFELSHLAPLNRPVFLIEILHFRSSETDFTPV